jgi:hypothetical protein
VQAETRLEVTDLYIRKIAYCCDGVTSGKQVTFRSGFHPQHLIMAEKNTREIKALGTTIVVSDVDFTPIEEPNCRYRLKDGTIVKVKNIATSIVKVVDQTLPTGDPIFMVFSGPVVSIDHQSVA